jgi:hypothetical protein
MNPEEKKYKFDYQPGRTMVQLEQERFLEAMLRTPEQRFRRMMQLIQITSKLKKLPPY